MEPNDLEYYEQRERTARQLATDASDPAIAAIHQQMADRYAVRIAEPTEKDARPQQA